MSMVVGGESRSEVDSPLVAVDWDGDIPVDDREWILAIRVWEASKLAR